MCENCKALLQDIKHNNLGSDIHYVCIDRRVTKNEQTYIILENQQELLLPPIVSKVPALLLLNDNYKVLFGKDIKNRLQPKQQTYKEVVNPTNTEPSAFSLSSMGDIVSDTFSFLDQDADELSAKGSGGLRQIHQYSTLNHYDKIDTPEENYESNTIGNQGIDMDKIQQERNTELKLA
jgi:hypothetical protein